MGKEHELSKLVDVQLDGQVVMGDGLLRLLEAGRDDLADVGVRDISVGTFSLSRSGGGGRLLLSLGSRLGLLARGEVLFHIGDNDAPVRTGALKHIQGHSLLSSQVLGSRAGKDATSLGGLLWHLLLGGLLRLFLLGSLLGLLSRLCLLGLLLWGSRGGSGTVSSVVLKLGDVSLLLCQDGDELGKKKGLVSKTKKSRKEDSKRKEKKGYSVHSNVLCA